MLYYAVLKRRLEINDHTAEKFISIIVIVKNEAAIVGDCLSALTAQNYPKNLFEIIVVDDGSSDGTSDILRDFAGAGLIRVLQKSRQKFKSSKKGALETALLKAEGEILLLTDADCLPGPEWIQSMVSHFHDDVGLVAGFSPQQSSKKVLNDLLIIDAAAAAYVAAGTIAGGKGVTCTGRNLAIQKQALIDIGGYAALPDSLSGDDDFVLQKISVHPDWDVCYAFDESSIVPAVGPSSLGAFLRQKQRHISAGRYYSFTAQLGFAVFHVANVILWMSLFYALFIDPMYLLPIVVKFVLDYFALTLFLRRFNLKLNIWSFLLWEPLYFYYNVLVGPLGFFRKLKWKD